MLLAAHRPPDLGTANSGWGRENLLASKMRARVARTTTERWRCAKVPALRFDPSPGAFAEDVHFVKAGA
jgi:hypothetical protein